MPIEKLKSSPGLMGSKALAVGVGAATGGIGGAALGLASANNKSIAGIAKLASLSGAASPGGESPIDEPQLGDSLPEGQQAPNLGVEGVDENPLARRFSITGMTPQEYEAHIHDGLDALKDLKETNPDIVEAYAPVLLQAKHFGFKNLRGNQ